MNVNFFKLFFAQFFTNFWIVRKKEIDQTWFSDSWSIFWNNSWDNLEYCNRFSRRISIFCCVLCKRLHCLIFHSIFFPKIQKFCSFYEVYIRKFKLIRSLLVIRFSKILYSTRWAYLLVYYHKWFYYSNIVITINGSIDWNTFFLSLFVSFYKECLIPECCDFILIIF